MTRQRKYLKASPRKAGTARDISNARHLHGLELKPRCRESGSEHRRKVEKLVRPPGSDLKEQEIEKEVPRRAII